MRRWRLWAPIAALAIGLAGCGSSATSSHRTATSRTATHPASTTSTQSTPASSTTTSGSTSTASTTTSASTPAAGTSECATSDLAASLGPGNGAAGTSYFQLRLRNTSSTTCVEQGYAGVSLLDAAGRQIGAAAVREPATRSKVVLSPGQTAYATLSIAEAGDYASGCGTTQAAELRVYPPDQTAALTVPFHGQGCTNTKDQLLRIQPFTSSPPG